MTELIRRFRGLGVALVVLALSAGAVFAAAPSFSPASDTDQGIEQPDGGPAATDDGESGADEDAGDEEADADADTDETADAADTGDDTAGDTHGALVSEAAHMPLDPRFTNRGAWVSCVAKLDKTVTLATVDWTQVTEDCVAAAEAKHAAKDAAKAERAAAKAERDAAKAARQDAKGKSPSAKDRTKTHGKHAPQG